MQNEHQIISDVYAAKENMKKADELIKRYIPFIRSETAKNVCRICTEQDDEFSIAMIAFHEAIQSYDKERGAFLKYASLVIRSRLIDYQRRESKHQGTISIYETDGEKGNCLCENLEDRNDYYEQAENSNAAKRELEELSKAMAQFGICFTDVAENSPKQERTLNGCLNAVQYAAENEYILDELMRTKKLPITRLAEGSGTERNTLERHRKYIVAMLLIQTNGYEIIRNHLKHTIRRKGGTSL